MFIKWYGGIDVCSYCLFEEMILLVHKMILLVHFTEIFINDKLEIEQKNPHFLKYCIKPLV